MLVKGPYVTLARDFAEGQRLEQILASGCGHRGLARLNWAFGPAPLYAHQEEALRAAEAGRNMTLRTLADICFALRHTPELELALEEDASPRWTHKRERIARSCY